MQMIKVSEGTAARRRIFFTMVDSTDLHTRKTGVTVTVRITKNGAADAASAGTVTEVGSTNMQGLYYYECTSGELDTVGTFVIKATGTACEPREVAVQVVSFDPYDAVRAGLTALPNANAEAAGGIYTRGSGAGQINQTINGFANVDVRSWMGNAPAALSATNGYVQTMMRRWLTDDAGGTPNALTSGRVEALVGSMAANVITAAATAADFSTEVTDAILAKVVVGTRTVKGVLKRMDAFIKGKATGLLGATAEFYDDDGTTVIISAGQDVAAGTRDAATASGD